MRSVIVCGNRNSRALESQLTRRFSSDLDITYIEDAMPRGAAGCVRDAALECDSQTFVVSDGAAIPNVDLDDLLASTARRGPRRPSSCTRDARPGQSSLQVPAGVYVFERRIIEPIARHGFVDIKEHLIPRSWCAAGERIATYVPPAPCRAC